MPANQTVHDRALKYLDLVRNEFRQRVELKQQVLSAYILGLAALIAFVLQGFKNNPQYAHALWLIPALSLCASAFFADHMLVTTSLSAYIKEELEPRLKTDGEIPFWDRANAMRTLPSLFKVLNGVEAAIACLPTVALLCFHWSAKTITDAVWLGWPAEIGLSVYACICLFFSVWLVQRIRHESSKVFGPRRRVC